MSGNHSSGSGLPPDDDNTCTILSSGFDYVVQLVLGVCCLLVILGKWWSEGEFRRPFWIFFADLCKQGGGFFLAHVGNIIMSELLQSSASPCVWYFINIFLDCTVRVVLAYLHLVLLVRFINARGYNTDGSLTFGEYGLPGEGEKVWHRWKEVVKRVFKQCLMWWGIVVVTRIEMGFVVWALKDPLADLGSWILGPLETYTDDHGHDLELIVVMMLIPAVLICLQLWVQDAFLQGDKWSGGSCCLRFCPCARYCGPRKETPTPEDAEGDTVNEDRVPVGGSAMDTARSSTNYESFSRA